MESEKISHKLYLQVRLSGNFWDTHSEMDEVEYSKNPTVWNVVINNLKALGFKVRVLGVIVKRQEVITEYN